MSGNGPRKRGRPVDPSIRTRIVGAAWALFLQSGVESTSIESVALAAGVSKVTLYRYFADKNELFEAGMEAEQYRLAELRSGFPPTTGDLRTRLLAFGEATMQYLTAGDAVDFYAVLAAELRRHPELARTFYSIGPGHTHAALEGIIRAGVDDGFVAVSDPAAAAEELFGAWQGFSNFQLALGQDPAPIRAAALARVRSSVRTFITAHASE